MNETTITTEPTSPAPAHTGINETSPRAVTVTTPTRSKSPGQVCFEAYSHAMHGITYDGHSIPAWISVPQQVRNGWEAAAAAVTPLPKSGEDA